MIHDSKQEPAVGTANKHAVLADVLHRSMQLFEAQASWESMQVLWGYDGSDLGYTTRRRGSSNRA